MHRTDRIPQPRVLLALAARQFANPLVVVLLAVSTISVFLHEMFDAGMVLAIVLGSAALGFTQEYLAGNAVARLMQRVAVMVRVQRDGVELRIPAAEVRIGDRVLLDPGTMVPADGELVEAHDLLVDQATLSGESFPTEKRIAPVAPPGDALRADHAYLGTSVISGHGMLRVLAVGSATRYGRLARRLTDTASRSAFERGLHEFGALLARLMLAMVGLVAGANLLLGRPGIESLLFATALAVGLTPELLPAVVSINLAHGARRMARAGVIVRRLDAIENLGSMDVLCTDKTGTLTTGRQVLHRAVGVSGDDDAGDVLRLAAANAAGQSASPNPLDRAILERVRDIDQAGRHGPSGDGAVVVDEIPYDFHRRCVSVVVDRTDGRWLVCKGAVREVLERCDRFAGPAGILEPLTGEWREILDRRFADWSAGGFRVLAVADRSVPREQSSFRRQDETRLGLRGFLLFIDPPRADAATTLARLVERGVHVRLLTGDNRHVALAVAARVGLPADACLTGRELRRLAGPELAARVESVHVFAELDPEQKEQLVAQLRRRGHVVGFLGDGINDALALHAADVGISVDSAADIARESADFVLLEKSLDSLREGIDEGRRTHANTLKYVLTTISANFGNMLSMAAASLVLPFLPLLASQVLLNNLLSDLPAMAIATDRVDPGEVARPRHWDNRRIRNTMIVFGALSSVFDLLTFATLLWLTHATVAQFRTGWFTESLLTELWVAMVVRTEGPCLRSRPGHLLLGSTLAVSAVAFILPLTDLGAALGFVPLPHPLPIVIAGLTLGYLVAVEAAKRRFFRRDNQPR